MEEGLSGIWRQRDEKRVRGKRFDEVLDEKVTL